MYYYKILTPKSFFTNSYDKLDIFNIPYGTTFVAPKHPRYNPDCPKCLIGESCFHFAQGAFDTMLWYTILYHHLLKETQIYRVQPLSRVVKQRCQDSEGIYQCGAHQIQFLDKQDINKMYDMAVQEYYTDSGKYDNFRINISLWLKHKPTCFILSKCYR